jgi:hypothetical protein
MYNNIEKNLLGIESRTEKKKTGIEPSKQRKIKKEFIGSWVVIKFRMDWKKDAMYRKSNLCIPRNETV